MKQYIYGLRDLGFRNFKSQKEFEDFKIYFETKIKKKWVVVITNYDLAL